MVPDMLGWKLEMTYLFSVGYYSDRVQNVKAKQVRPFSAEERDRSF